MEWKLVQAGLKAAKKAGVRLPPKPLPDYVYAYGANAMAGLIELVPAFYVQALGLGRGLCQAHCEQRLCNWIVGEGPQNILVVTGSLAHFALLQI
jgi:hypothetical protein